MMLRVCGGIFLFCKDFWIIDMLEGLVCLLVDELLFCCMVVGVVDCFWGEEEVFLLIILLFWEIMVGWVSLGLIIFFWLCFFEFFVLFCLKY